MCDYCGKESCVQSEIESCEASHLGLTLKEKCLLDTLKEDVEYISSVMSFTNNVSTRAAYDNAVTRLMLFE